MNQPKVVLALRLMKMLQNNKTLTIDEIAAQLEVVPRTIYRYIDTFKESGFSSRSSVFRILNEANVQLDRGRWKGPLGPRKKKED